MMSTGLRLQQREVFLYRNLLGLEKRGSAEDTRTSCPGKHRIKPVSAWGTPVWAQLGKTKPKSFGHLLPNSIIINSASRSPLSSESQRKAHASSAAEKDNPAGQPGESCLLPGTEFLRDWLCRMPGRSAGLEHRDPRADRDCPAAPNTSPQQQSYPRAGSEQEPGTKSHQ